MTQLCKSEQRDKLAVILLCGAALAILGGISAGAIAYQIPNDSQTLLGVIVGGVLLFARECLQAIRAFWQDAKTGKLTDQLAKSQPVSPPDGGEPQPVVIEQPDDKPVPVEERG